MKNPCQQSLGEESTLVCAPSEENIDLTVTANSSYLKYIDARYIPSRVLARTRVKKACHGHPLLPQSGFLTLYYHLLGINGIGRSPKCLELFSIDVIYFLLTDDLDSS